MCVCCCVCGLCVCRCVCACVCVDVCRCVCVCVCVCILRYIQKQNKTKQMAMLDLTSLYPSIVIDTPEPNSTTVDLPGDRKAHFTANKPGLLPTSLRAFIEERSCIKKLMQTHEKGSVNYRTLDSRQQAIKTVNNSFYGLLGSSLPFGFERIAESVTTFGRAAIQRTNSYFEPSYPVTLTEAGGGH